MSNLLELNIVREQLEKWLVAFNNKDIEALIGLYDSESLYAGNSAPLLRGSQAIKAYHEKNAAHREGQLLYKEEAAFQEGNLALLVGKYYFKFPIKNRVSTTGRVALVFRKRADGKWYLLFDMDNCPPDVCAEDFE